MISRGAKNVCTTTTTYPAMMYQCSGVPVTMRNVPSPMPAATPIATAMRRPQVVIVPPDTCCALSATAMSDGSATVVAKPIAAPNAYTQA
jgi:hypothetical protein